LSVVKRAPHSTLRGAAAVVAVSLLVSAMLAETLHESLVRHVRCATHGEWVHETEVRGATAAAKDAQSLEASPAAEAGHTHQHCAASGHAWSFSSSRSLAVGTSPTIGGSCLRASAARGWSVPLYSLAPKASPPPLS
jgi:hypothetical protein